MTEHTKEPWAHRNGRIYQADRDVLTIANIARASDGDYSENNARRIVACVNACEGLPTEPLEQFGLGTAFGTALFDVTAQRDQLLAAAMLAKNSIQLERNALLVCHADPRTGLVTDAAGLLALQGYDAVLSSLNAAIAAVKGE